VIRTALDAEVVGLGATGPDAEVVTRRSVKLYPAASGGRRAGRAPHTARTSDSRRYADLVRPMGCDTGRAPGAPRVPPGAAALGAGVRCCPRSWLNAEITECLSFKVFLEHRAPHLSTEAADLANSIAPSTRSAVNARRP